MFIPFKSATTVFLKLPPGYAYDDTVSTCYTCMYNEGSYIYTLNNCLERESHIENISDFRL